MSQLKVFHQDRPQQAELLSRDGEEIARLLSEVGVRFERWSAEAPIESGASPAAVIAAYRSAIDHLIESEGYQTVDVVSMTPDHPQREAFREKVRAEHTHSEDEVRFFVAGQGLFSLHLDERVYELLCVKEDLICVPRETPHWFDMGPAPDFVAIRLFNDPAGWVADYTGSEVARRFSSLEASA